MREHKSATSIGRNLIGEPMSVAALKFSAIVLAMLVFYFQDLKIVFTVALTNAFEYQILAIPILFSYLLYLKKDTIASGFQSRKKDTSGFRKSYNFVAGILLCAVSLLAYWYGIYTFSSTEYHMLTLPFFVAGLILVLFNTQTLKKLAFPLAFLFFLTPPPDQFINGLGSLLANLSAAASNGLANLFGMHATISSSNIGPIITLSTPSQGVLLFNVAIECSGIYSLIGFVVFAVFTTYITKSTIWSKLFFIIMGIPLVLALNIIRITILLGIGDVFGENLTLIVFHDVAGTVLIFFGVLIMLFITDKAFKKPEPLVLTNSGGVQEEPCILGVPCVTLRDNAEGPETLDVCANVLAGTSPNRILAAAKTMRRKQKNWGISFCDGKTVQKIIEILLKG